MVVEYSMWFLSLSARPNDCAVCGVISERCGRVQVPRKRGLLPRYANWGGMPLLFHAQPFIAWKGRVDRRMKRPETPIFMLYTHFTTIRSCCLWMCHKAHASSIVRLSETAVCKDFGIKSWHDHLRFRRDETRRDENEMSCWNCPKMMAIGRTFPPILPQGSHFT